MTPTTTHWVLWTSLMLLLPLPVYAEAWGCLPAADLFIAIFTGEGSPGWLLGLQAVFWSLIFQGVAHMYCVRTARLEPKIRGSLMSVAMFVLLILVASAPVFRVPYGEPGEALTLSWLYE